MSDEQSEMNVVMNHFQTYFFPFNSIFICLRRERIYRYIELVLFLLATHFIGFRFAIALNFIRIDESLCVKQKKVGKSGCEMFFKFHQQ